MNRGSTLILLLVVVVVSGCSIGYRYTGHHSTFTRDDGRELEIRGSSHSGHLAASFDFRYFRLMVPFEGGRRVIRVRDDEGNPDTIELIRERRFYRLDVPLVSLWDLENKQFGGYPGSMRHRKSLELWLSGESNAQIDHEWWVDLSFVRYAYNGVGIKVYGGAGAVPFDAATPVQGTRFPRLWHGNAPMFGAGIEFIFFTGEYGLDVVEYLLGLDRDHRERSRKYGWD
jgi:hypothetical protein